MAASIFNDQATLAGQKLGISTGKALALTVMACGLAAMNIYHMGNAVTSKLLTPDSSVAAYALLYFIASCIAFMEVPVTEEIVTQDARGRQAKGHRLMLAVIVTMAIGAGLYSITSDADKRASKVTAHETAELSYSDRAHALISDRNIARSNATTSAERSQANADYYRALAELRLEQSSHQSTRPALAVSTDSIFHWIWAIGFSLLCSLGVVVITAYLTKYHKPLTEIPRVFFRVREEQNWTMNDDDVRVIPAHVDLTNGQSNSSARKALNSRPSLPNTDSLTSDSKRDASNRPQPDESIAGAVLKDSESVSVRTLKKAEQVDYSDTHYRQIEQGVLSGDIKPTHRPIRATLIALNVKFVDDAARAKKAAEILKRLQTDRVIIENPAFGKSGKVVAKYLINPDYQTMQPAAEEGASNRVQLSEPLNCICPECGAAEWVTETSPKGRVKSSCGTVYKAADNLK